jgi:hypothetical protein
MKSPGSLDPLNPDFEYMGPTICRRTICFIMPNGHLFWVPHLTLNVWFKNNIKKQGFSTWLIELESKESGRR